MCLFNIFNKRILLSEVSEGLVDDIAIFDCYDVIGKLNEAELFAVVVDIELLTLLDVDVVEED